MYSVMIHALRAFRAEADLLTNVMDVFVREPSFDWKVGFVLYVLFPFISVPVYDVVCFMVKMHQIMFAKIFTLFCTAFLKINTWGHSARKLDNPYLEKTIA